jgi:hypothetical protein
VLRRLLVALTEQPQAAVELRLVDNAAVLRHLGSDELELDLSTAAVRTVRWTDGFPVADWEGQVNGPRSATASPGWTWEIPLGNGRNPNATITAHVDNLLLFDGQFWTACSLQSPMQAVEQASATNAWLTQPPSMWSHTSVSVAPRTKSPWRWSSILIGVSRSPRRRSTGASSEGSVRTRKSDPVV